jgi:RNA polymerase sigma-70 factor (ECF subfamily)
VPAHRTATGASPFEQVYRDYAGQVYRFCLAQVGSPHDAEDLASEVFVSALADYPRSRPAPAATLPWLLRIARNAAIDAYRRRGRRTALLDRYFGRVVEADPDADVEAEVVLRDELRAVLAAMERLPPRDRQLVGLRLAAGLSFADIGVVLDISEHAATVATGRAVHRLRRLVEQPRGRRHGRS